MKIKAYDDTREIELEVYKVQVSIFGQLSILIYDEERKQMYETFDPDEIKAIRKFIGKKTSKCYVAGSLTKGHRIKLIQVIPENISQHYDW